MLSSHKPIYLKKHQHRTDATLLKRKKITPIRHNLCTHAMLSNWSSIRWSCCFDVKFATRIDGIATFLCHALTVVFSSTAWGRERCCSRVRGRTRGGWCCVENILCAFTLPKWVGYHPSDKFFEITALNYWRNSDVLGV